MKVGIAGAGGIGSNVAMNLIRTGIRHLKIVDYDKVERSNLNRQFYFENQIGKYKVDMLCENLKKIDNESNIEKLILKINEGNISKIFNDCDIVVEAFDRKECKKMFLETLSKENKILVSASGIAGSELSTLTHRKMGNCYIVGDLQSDTLNDKVYSPKVMAVACMMSNIIIEKMGIYEQ